MVNVKIIIVTSGGMNGRRLAYLFSNNNIPYELLTVSFPLPKKQKKSSISYFKKYIRSVLANIRIFRRIKMKNLPTYPINEQFIGRINGERMLKRLKEISPDYIFMMGGGILKDYIINTAKIGVLNAHPGILPLIRGVDAIKHSVLNEVPIGITGHFIDAGIDTGAIIDRYWLPIGKDDTFDEVVSRSDDLSVAVMVKLAFDIMNGKKLTTLQQNKRYKLYKRLGIEKSKNVTDKFYKDWYKKHNKRIGEMDNLKSGKILLDEYKLWWSDMRRF